MLNKFIRELRRREVFRTAGLYVGIGWLLVEVASVVLPAFDAPEWVLRAMIIVMVVGFPVALVLAWIYDFTEHGIVVQGDPTDTVVPPTWQPQDGLRRDWCAQRCADGVGLLPHNQWPGRR